PTVTLPGDAPAATPDAATPAAATPTLRPTTTPATTPGATPETDPATVRVAAAPLPPISRDALLIGDGALKLWRTAGQLTTLLPGANAAPGERTAAQRPLIGDVVLVATAENSRQLVAARVTGSDASDDTLPQTVALLALSPDGGTPRLVADGIPGIRELALAPDGRHVAVIAQTAVAPLADAAFQVQVFQVDSGVQRLAAPCSSACAGLAWHPDNQNVAWADPETAVWLFNLGSSEPQRLLENQGGPQNVDISIPVSWAQNGRFLLLRHSAFLEGSESRVLDVVTGQTAVVPDSFYYVEPHVPQVVWMADSRLLVSRPRTDGETLATPALEIWRLQPEAGELVLEAQDVLPLPPAGITAPVHLADGRFGFAIYAAADPDSVGLYVLKGIDDTLTRANALWPANSAGDLHVSWNPDGSGALVQIQGELLYAPTGGDALYAVTPAAGQLTGVVHWLPLRPPNS
ncbi:MAG: hypothetical protein KC425_25610, partial [Anaerolineales bacterium]|nr:hypothetical protein [Anaerolineales bacterium]